MTPTSYRRGLFGGKLRFAMNEAALGLLRDVPLSSGSALSLAFQRLGCRTFADAAELAWQLPYGRTVDTDVLAVLREERGTCSSKHALLANLGRDESVPMRLMLGIYHMTGMNTPGVGPVLARHGLAGIPEAHCWLDVMGAPLDITRVLAGAQVAPAYFLRTELIRPEQVGEYKRRFHQDFLADWADSADAGGLTADGLWRVREECIAALGS